MAVFFAGPLIIIVLLIVLLSAALFVVPQQQAYIIERFGKFLKVQFAGIHIRIPFVDRIAMKTNMRVNQLNVQLETKTLDNVFVTVVASTQFRVNPNDVATAYYELRDPAGQLRSYMEDALRSAIPALSLDDAFARKDDVAFDVQKTLGAEMSRFGFTVVKTLITAIDPSPQVKNAMDSINAAQREKEATRQRAEADPFAIRCQGADDGILRGGAGSLENDDAGGWAGIVEMVGEAVARRRVGGGDARVASLVGQAEEGVAQGIGSGVLELGSVGGLVDFNVVEAQPLGGVGRGDKEAYVLRSVVRAAKVAIGHFAGIFDDLRERHAEVGLRGAFHAERFPGFAIERGLYAANGHVVAVHCSHTDSDVANGDGS